MFSKCWREVFLNTDNDARRTMRRTQVNIEFDGKLYRIRHMYFDEDTLSFKIVANCKDGPMDGPDYNPDWVRVDGEKGK